MQLDWDQLRHLLHPWVQFHPIFARIAGGALPGLMLSILYFWDGKGKRPDGFIYKSQREWTAQTSMTRGEIARSRRRLLELGLIEAERKGLPCTWHYRVHRDAVLRDIELVMRADSEFAGVRQTERTPKQPSSHPGGKVARDRSTVLLDDGLRASSSPANTLNINTSSNTPTTADTVVEGPVREGYGPPNSVDGSDHSAGTPSPACGGDQHNAQVDLLVKAGMSYRSATKLPQRDLAYVKQVIGLVRSRRIGIGGLYTAMKEGNWNADTGRPSGSSGDTWSVDPAYRRAWDKISPDIRLAALQAAQAKFTREGQRTHIEAVIAGTSTPRQWLIDEVIVFSRLQPQ